MFLRRVYAGPGRRNWRTQLVGQIQWVAARRPECTCLPLLAVSSSSLAYLYVKMKAKPAKLYCIAFGCINNNKDPNLTFFTLPKDIERRRKWLTSVDRKDLLQKEGIKWRSYVVCSAHFEDSSIKIVKHLKEDAAPTMLLLNQSQDGSSSSETQSTSVKIKEEKDISQNYNKLDAVEIKTESSQEGSSCTEAQYISVQIKEEVDISPNYNKYDTVEIKVESSQESPSCSETQLISVQIKEVDISPNNKRYDSVGTKTEPSQEVSSSEAQSTSVRIKEEVSISPNYKSYYNVGTQTVSLQSAEAPQAIIQTSKLLTDGTPRKRKLSNELKECLLKRQRLDEKITKIKKELQANNP